MNMQTKINKSIMSLAKSEKNVKAQVSVLSRDLLQYIVLDDSGDIQSANRFINALSPVNRKVAIAFLSAFLPYQVKKDEAGKFVGFGKKIKTQHDDKLLACTVFLSDEDATLWTWADANIEVKAKPVNYLGNIQRNVSKAIEDEQISKTDIIAAVLAGGLTADDLLGLLAEAAGIAAAA